MRVRVVVVRRVAAVWLGLVGLCLLTIAWLSVAPVEAVMVVQAVPPPRTPAAYRPAVAAMPVDALAAPAQGVTGTTPLPALPVDAELATLDRGVVAARPFAMAGARVEDRARALQCLTAAVYYEAASEPDAGQQAVAQVVLNRARHPAFPATVCGVVYQGSEHSGCQFSFACDGAMARVPSAAGWARAARTAATALNGRVFAPVGLATHYHTYAVTPAWNRGLVMTDVVGAHFFHRWKGYWGTAAAFRQAYGGGEPVPGPHRAVEVVPPALAVPPLPAALPAPPTLPAPPAPVVRPARADGGIAPALPAAPEDALPPASEVLDRWKDSGKPLR